MYAYVYWSYARDVSEPSSAAVYGQSLYEDSGLQRV